MAAQTESERWREKYLALTERIEEREAVLRRGIVCVSLAVDNMDPALEQRLKSLRERLRGNWETAELAELVDVIEQQVRLLDERRSQDRGQMHEQFGRMVALLEPLGSDRKSRKLIAGLATQAEHVDLDLPRFLTEFLSVFDQLIEGFVQQGHGGSQPGLLKRLFGSKNQSEPRADVSEESPAVTETEASVIEPVESRSEESQSEVAQRIADVLLGVLEQLQSESPEQVSQLQDRCRNTKALEEMPELLQETLHVQQTLAVQRARETENFLLALSQRLVDVYRFLAGEQDRRTKAAEEVGSFDSHVRDEINELRTQVQAASNLPDLKHTIELRVQGILQLVDRYRIQTESSGRSLHTEVQELEARLKRMEKESARLREMVRNEHKRALLDALTGVANRQALQDRSRQEYQRWKRYGNPLSLIMVDVDFFKKINDRFGHLAGDKVLVKVAQTLNGQLRQTDFMARYGGEEFAILLPQTQREEAMQVAEKLRQHVQDAPFHFSGEPVKVTCSMGVAELREGDSWEQAVDRADQCLLRAKQEGRNCVRADA